VAAVLRAERRRVLAAAEHDRRHGDERDEQGADCGEA
jgi:hypothetical protein